MEDSIRVQTRTAPPSHWAAPAIEIVVHLLPPLPVIRDTTLRQQAYTHQGALTQRGLSAEDNYQAQLDSNRRAEWAGDDRIQHEVTDILTRRFKDLHAGGLADLRARIVRNTTLAHIGYAYRLDEAMILDPTQGYEIPLRQQLYIVADAFEAHIGALGQDDRAQGAKKVSDWFKSLFNSGALPTLDQDAAELRSRGIQRGCDGRASLQKKRRLSALEEGKVSSVSSSDVALIRHHIDESLALHQWKDRRTRGAGWHSCLQMDNKTVSCGVGHKKDQARESALRGFIVTQRGLGAVVAELAADQSRECLAGLEE